MLEPLIKISLYLYGILQYIDISNSAINRRIEKEKKMHNDR